ncbi:MAG: lytic transglycosylase domain-containing protein [Geminicoccaceae bacterium]
MVRCSSLKPFRLIAAGLVWTVGALLGPATANETPGAGEEDPAAVADLPLLEAPDILSAADAAIYQRVFRLQEDGNWGEADIAVAALDDRLLMGHVLRQRYLHPSAYRSEFEELVGWLATYDDHPGALRIFRLAEKRRPADAALPPQPDGRVLLGSGQELAHESAKSQLVSALREAPAEISAIYGQVKDFLAEGRPLEAAAVLPQEDVDNPLSRLVLDAAAARLARYRIFSGEIEAARVVADAAVERSASTFPSIRWEAGLAAWHDGDYLAAADHWTELANSDEAVANDIARAAFWAARAHLRNGRSEVVGSLFRQAVEHGTTFYALLARQMVGDDLDFSWESVLLTERDAMEVSDLEGARRAIALTQVGQRSLAEQELRKLGAESSADRLVKLIGLARLCGLPAVEMRLAQHLAMIQDDPYFPALYPLPDWSPEETDKAMIDQALIFAVVRAESGFDQNAVSPAGAAGPMQLMPTAVEAAIGAKPKLSDVAGRYQNDPAVNLSLGNAYLQLLLSLPEVDGELIKMLTAYNLGPTRIRTMMEKAKTWDPILFIETIPYEETRRYTKKVLANLWMYRSRLGEPISSLKALGAYEWPLYTHPSRRVEARAGH